MIQPGKHYFSGITTYLINGKNYCTFVLDDITYEAYEKGITQKSIDNINEKDVKCKYAFPPQEVILIEDENSFIGDYIKMYDTQNGKLILRIEAECFDSYYPCAIFEYYPKNMKINENR